MSEVKTLKIKEFNAKTLLLYEEGDEDLAPWNPNYRLLLSKDQATSFALKILWASTKLKLSKLSMKLKLSIGSAEL